MGFCFNDFNRDSCCGTLHNSYTKNRRFPCMETATFLSGFPQVSYFGKPGFSPSDTFKRFFKVDRQTVQSLCEMLSNYPELRQRIAPGGRDSITVEKKVLMTLCYMASQETLHALSDRFGVTEYAFHKSKRQVVSAINNHLLRRFIKWPSLNELPNIATEFNDAGLKEFPGIVGAIDGSHIAIESPQENPQSYFNRKKFSSIILQAVCLYDLTFTDICVDWPGRVHDAKVFSNSALYNFGFQKCGNGIYHIIGDAAYPLKEWVLTPYRDRGHLSPQETHYNTCLSSKRQVIERAFASLKGRFRRLKYINIKSLQEICETVSAACVLHNICIVEKDGVDIDDVDQDDDDFQPAVPFPALQIDARWNLKRIRITNQLR